MNTEQVDMREAVEPEGMRRPLPAWSGYLITILAVAPLVGTLLLVDPLIPLGRYPMVYIMLVMLCTYFLGEGPGALSLILGWLAFSGLFLPPDRLWPLATTPVGWAAQISFLLGTAIIFLAAGFVRRSRRRIQQLVSELEEEIEERKRALEALEKERRRIAAIERLSEAALTAGSLEEVLTTIAIGIREGMGTHSCTLFLLDDEKNDLEAVAAGNIPEAVGFRIAVGEGFAGKIFQERRTMYIRDAEHDPLVTDPHIKRAGISSLLGTPLIGRRGAVGVVYVNTKEIHEFSVEDRRLLEELASRTALIIENARLVEEISHNYALLQRALLPARPPEYPGYAIASAYLPAPEAEIGGDFYDFFTTENGKVAIIIGDVSGKGIPSASLAVATRSTVRAFAYDISSPDQALAHANSALKGAKDDPSLFVTVLLVTLDISTGRICYSSAGHPPPAIYRARTGEVDFLTVAGLLLGVVDQHDYEESETHLDAGDRLVLYTDGLLEARHGGELFGFEGIKRVLKESGQRSPDELVEALVRESAEWAGGRRADDAAIIVVQRQ